MEIILTSGAVQLPVTVREGVDVGHLRTLRRELEEIGAPSTFTFAVNGVGVEDSAPLTEGALVSFRPINGTKGA